jgi:uncharacterized alpha-E superfamily protein
MIARVAQTCFWLHRYLERAENTARLLQVSLHVALDVELPERELWQPVLAVSGEERRFRSLHGADALGDAEMVQEFMVWEERNPVSLVHSLRLARDNARTIRETISLEMWQALNSCWLWMEDGRGRRLYDRERHAFYERVKTACQLFHGLYHTTMLFDEPFDFMRLGSLLERADQTARILLAMYRPSQGRGRADAPGDAARWLATLRSCSAIEPFMKRTRGTLIGSAVAGFLLYDERFPRSVLHCTGRAQVFLDRVRGAEGAGGPHESARRLGILVSRLRSARLDIVPDAGLTDELGALLDGIAGVGEAITEDFFDMSVPHASGEY